MTTERAAPEPDALDRLGIEVMSSLELSRVLRRISRGLVERCDAAFARIWLLGPGDLCATCHVAEHCPDRERCLHLVASAGAHTRLDGSYRRVPLGAFKIGKIAQGWGPTSTSDVERDDRIPDKEWVRGNGFRSFAGYPLIFREELLGVIAIFSRRALDQAEFNRLALFAHQAAIAIKNATRHAEAVDIAERLREDNETLRRELGFERGSEQIVGRSPAIRRVVARAQDLGTSRAPVLILGEMGTGKALLARVIHASGPRSARPLVRLRCGNHPPAAVEDILIERLASADGGSLFLDEIAELPGECQERLIAFLRDRRVPSPNGGPDRIIDARVIASTRRDPEREALEGRLERELVDALGGERLELPPLRERRRDIPLLASYFVNRLATRVGRRIDGVSQDTLRRLLGYPWPGNVRELRNVLERALALSRGPRLVVDPSVVAADPVPGAGVPPSLRLRDVERLHIVDVLKRTGGVIEGRQGAAVLLGLPPSTLRSRMARLGIRVGKTVRRS